MKTFRERVAPLGIEADKAFDIIESLTDDGGIGAATKSRWMDGTRDPASRSPTFTVTVRLLRMLPWQSFRKLCREAGVTLKSDPREPIGGTGDEIRSHQSGRR